MPFCPTCASEFRPGFARCEECDVALVAELAVLPPPPSVPCPVFRKVYSGTELSEALALNSLLEGHGIQTSYENQHSALFVCGIPTAAVPYVIRVPAADAADADGIVKEALESRTRPAVSDRVRRRWWLVAIALMVPVPWWDIAAYESAAPYFAAGMWGLFVLALILDVRIWERDAAFSEHRILTFWILGAVVSTAIAVPLEFWLRHVEVPGERLRTLHMFAGPIEETAKFLPALMVFLIRPSWFREPLAWVVACASTGAGFGLVETFMGFQVSHHDSVATLSRGAAGLLHPLLSGMVGTCIAKVESGRVVMAVGALLLASVVHGGWNALNYEGLGWVCFLAMLLALWFYLRNVGRIFPDPTIPS